MRVILGRLLKGSSPMEELVISCIDKHVLRAAPCAPTRKLHLQAVNRSAR